MTSIFSFRVATQNDVKALIDLSVEAFGEGTREIAEEEFLTIGKDVRCPLHMLVATAEGRIVGMASLCESYIYIDTFCIAWVAVAKEYQGKGIGTKLIRECMEYAKTLTKRQHGCVMLVSADKNLTYYAQFGFKGQTKIHPYINEDSDNTILTHVFQKSFHA